MFLIDTDVLSALRKRERNPEVVKWIADRRAGDIYLSVVSIGEIERGLATARGRDAVFAGRLEDWLDAVLRLYGRPRSAGRLGRCAALGADSPTRSATPGPTC